jgi:hypothetical protein
MALTKIKLDSMITGTLPDANIPDNITITNLSGTNTGDQTLPTAGTLSGTELKSTVVTSSLTSVGTLTGLTLSGAIVGSNGSASAPSHSFSANTDSGMYSPADNQLGLASGGTLALIFGGDQSATFSSDVEVGGTLYAPEYIKHVGDTDTSIRFSDADNIEISAGGVKLARFKGDNSNEIIFNEDSADVDFRVESDNLTHALFVQGSDGKVGINKTPSDWHLDVDSPNQYIMSLDGSNNTGLTINSDSGQADIIGYSNSASSYNKINIRGASGTGLVVSGLNVGIGTTAPDNKFHVYTGDASQASNTSFTQLTVEHSAHSGINILSGATSQGNVWFGDSGSNSDGLISYDHNTRRMIFGTAGVERVWLDSSGNVGIGVTPSSYYSNFKALDVGAGAGTLTIQGRTSASGGATFITRNSYFASSGVTDKIITTGYTSGIAFGTDGSLELRTGGSSSQSAGATVSWNSALTIANTGNATFSGDAMLGGVAQIEGAYTNLQLYMPDNATGLVLANGSSQTDARNWGIYSNYSHWGALDFRVSSARATEAHTTEVLSLKKDKSATFSGSAKWGNPSTGNQGVLIGSNGCPMEYYVSTTGGSNLLEFANPNGGIGSILASGSGVTYNTSSDYRLKENATAISDGITRLKQLKPYRFNFKTDSDKTVDGFFAHEVSSIIPEAISGEKDAVDEDGNDINQMIDQSKLVPLLVSALQEAVDRIEALENA